MSSRLKMGDAGKTLFFSVVGKTVVARKLPEKYS